MMKCFYMKNSIHRESEVKYKEYPSAHLISLPKTSLPSISLESVLYKRFSSRTYSLKRVTKSIISNLLYYAFGVNDKYPQKIHRFYPSAGAKYPIECYFISLNTGIKRGVYHYHVKKHKLEIIRSSIPSSPNLDMTIPQFADKNPAFFIVLTGIPQRSIDKYGILGNQYTFMEAGHVGQNIQLLCAAHSLRSAPIGGGFKSNDLRSLLKLNSQKESIIYLFAIGYGDKNKKEI